MGRYTAPIEQLAQFLYGWQDVQISLERMKEIRDREEEESESRSIAQFPFSSHNMDIQLDHFL